MDVGADGRKRCGVRVPSLISTLNALTVVPPTLRLNIDKKIKLKQTIKTNKQ